MRAEIRLESLGLFGDLLFFYGQFFADLLEVGRSGEIGSVCSRDRRDGGESDGEVGEAHVVDNTGYGGGAKRSRDNFRLDLLWHEMLKK